MMQRNRPPVKMTLNGVVVAQKIIAPGVTLTQADTPAVSPTVSSKRTGAGVEESEHDKVMQAFDRINLKLGLTGKKSR